MQQQEPVSPREKGVARFARRTKVGFWTVAITVLVVDVSLLTTVGATSDTAMKAWWSVNFVSFPCVFSCVSLSAPSMGESEDTSWDYTMMAISLVTSCIIWGAVGAGIAKLTAKRPAA